LHSFPTRRSSDLDPRQNLHWLLGDGAGKSVNGLVQRGRNRLDRKPFEGHDQRVSKAAQAITMAHNALVFHLIEDLADLGWRAFAMIQKRNEISDRALEIDVVLPQRVVGVDQEGLRMDFLFWH